MHLLNFLAIAAIHSNSFLWPSEEILNGVYTIFWKKHVSEHINNVFISLCLVQSKHVKIHSAEILPIHWYIWIYLWASVHRLLDSPSDNTFIWCKFKISNLNSRNHLYLTDYLSYTHMYQQLKVWFSNSRNLKKCNSIKNTIWKIWRKNKPFSTRYTYEKVNKKKPSFSKINFLKFNFSRMFIKNILALTVR